MQNIIPCYVIMICYGLIYVFAGWRLEEFAWIFLIALFFSYIQHIKILISAIRLPKILAKGENLKTAAKAVVQILILIVLNLYLGVLYVRLWIPEAYVVVLDTKSYVTDLDLLYYTILTFTEIGCGDIVPQHMASRIMAIIIAITSVLCLILFLSSFMEEKENLE